MKSFVLTAGLLLGTTVLTPAVAGTILFSGSQTNTNAPASSSAGCGGALEVTINNAKPFYSTGSSNLGSFTTSQSHCLNSGPPLITPMNPDPNPVDYFAGQFAYTFGDGDILKGTYTGTLTHDKGPGSVLNSQDFIIDGGTGIFADATGTFHGDGSINFGSGMPVSTIEFTGTITAPGIAPEPATWAMLICGFGAIGGMLRTRHRTIAVLTA